MDKRRAIQIMTKAGYIGKHVTAQPAYKVFAVISKHYTDNKYSYIAKLDKSIDLKECHFSEEIESLIERGKMQHVK